MEAGVTKRTGGSLADYLGWKGSPLAWSATASPKILVGKPPENPRPAGRDRDMRADTTEVSSDEQALGTECSCSGHHHP